MGLRGCARAMRYVRLAALDQLNQTLWPQVKYRSRLDQRGKWEAVDVSPRVVYYREWFTTESGSVYHQEWFTTESSLLPSVDCYRK